MQPNTQESIYGEDPLVKLFSTAIKYSRARSRKTKLVAKLAAGRINATVDSIMASVLDGTPEQRASYRKYLTLSQSNKISERREAETFYVGLKAKKRV